MANITPIPKQATVFNPQTKQTKVVNVGDPNAFKGGFRLMTPTDQKNLSAYQQTLHQKLQSAPTGPTGITSSDANKIAATVNQNQTLPDGLSGLMPDGLPPDLYSSIAGDITAIKTAVDNMNTPPAQQLSDLYQNLYNAKPKDANGNPIDGSLSLAELDQKIGGITSAMTMTESDIRKEALSSGGDVTESQVQALVATRNQVLKGQLDSFSALRDARSSYIDQVVNLTGQDRTAAAAQVDKAIGYQDKLVQLETTLQATGYKQTQSYATYMENQQKTAQAGIKALYSVGGGTPSQAMWTQAGFTGAPPALMKGGNWSPPDFMANGDLFQTNYQNGQVKILAKAKAGSSSGSVTAGLIGNPSTPGTQANAVANLAASVVATGLFPPNLPARATQAEINAGTITQGMLVDYLSKNNPEFIKSGGLQRAELNIKGATTFASTQNSTTMQQTLDLATSSFANMPKYVSLINSLSSTKFPIINDAVINAKAATGDPQAQQLKTLVTVLGDEVAKVFGGSASSDFKMRSAIELFHTGLTPLQARANIQTIKSALQARIDAIKKGNYVPAGNALAPGTTADISKYIKTK